MKQDFGYAYSNTRVKGMKTRLLKKEDYSGLLRCKKVTDVVSLLEHTVYRKEISSIEDHKVSTVERALLEHLVNSLKKLKELAPGDVDDIFDALRFKYEVGNIKTILNAKISGMDVEDIRSYIFYPIQQHELLTSLIEAEDVDALVKVLLKEGFRMNKSLEVYKEKKTPIPLLTTLDKNYYARLWKCFSMWDFFKSNRQIAKDLVGLEMDCTNILTLLRAKTYGYDAKPLLLPNYKIQILMDALVKAETPEQVKSLLSETIFKQCLGDTLVESEMATKRFMAKRYRRLTIKDPLDVGVMLGYMRLKEIEVENLVVICNAVANGLDEKEIEKLLVI